MSSDTREPLSHRWRVSILNLETRVRVGIHAHEMNPQRMLVSATIEGYYPLKPKSISECFNYDHINALVCEEWPERDHTGLLETYVTELLEYLFRIDDRVVCAKVKVSKPDIFPHAESAGVEAEWTREEFKRFTSGEP